ncbi:MAG: tetratricopeptide repeat protein [Syntrophomonas sp.]
MKKRTLIIFTVLALVLSFSQFAEAATEQEYYDQGVELFNQGNYEDALHHFEEAASLNPSESAYYDWQGSCLYYLVAFDEALPAFNKALALEPYYTTYEYKGVCLAALDRLEEALAAFEQSIALHPYQNNYFWKAAVLVDLQEFNQAADTYLTVAVLNGISDENKALAYNNAAYVLYLGQNYAAAMTAAENGLALKPDKPNLYKNKGLILEAQGNYDEALENYNRALQIDPENEASLTARRNLLARLNKDQLDPSEYAEWEEIKLYVPLDKVWTIKFNRPADLRTAQEYIYIADSNNNRLNLEIEAGTNADEIKILLGDGQNYLPATRYTLFVPANVASASGAKMLNGIKMDFITN